MYKLQKGDEWINGRCMFIILFLFCSLLSFLVSSFCFVFCFVLFIVIFLLRLREGWMKKGWSDEKVVRGCKRWVSRVNDWPIDGLIDWWMDWLIIVYCQSVCMYVMVKRLLKWNDKLKIDTVIMSLNLGEIDGRKK